jgi:uncharacterized protein (DUF1697 family)
MAVYIALFRGINVGGRNRLPMRELVQALEGLGLQRIETYIQSGNVVFQSDETITVDLADRMGATIHEWYGFTPQVFVLELGELESAMASNPFRQAESEPKTLHLYFLASVPQNPDLAALESIKGNGERFALVGKVFYLHAPGGIGRSRLAARVERALGVAVTARNWRSVCKIVDITRRSN